MRKGTYIYLAGRNTHHTTTQKTHYSFLTVSQQASGAVDRVAPNDHLVGEGHCDRAEAERKAWYTRLTTCQTR